MAANRGPRLRVLGDRAAFLKQHADRQEAALRTGTPSIGPKWGEDPPEYWGVLTDGAREEPVRSEPGAYQHFYGELAAMLRDESPPPVAAEDALAGLEIIQAAQRSAAERRVVTLG